MVYYPRISILSYDSGYIYVAMQSQSYLVRRIVEWHFLLWLFLLNILDN